MSALVEPSRHDLDASSSPSTDGLELHQRRRATLATPSKIPNNTPITFPIPTNISSDRSAAFAPNPHSPLPLVSIVPPHPSSLRASLARRRSSYPPGNGAVSFNAFPFGTPQATSTEVYKADHLSGYGKELSTDASMSVWTPGVAWEGLLEFNNGVQHSQDEDEPRLGSELVTSAKSEPRTEHTPKMQLPFKLESASPSKLVQFTSDLAWRTILGSVIEVEGVGEVGVGRVLHEVWKRGGGDVVSAQCLWPSVVMSLSFSPHGDPNVRVSQPSASSSFALQQLYNMTLRLWEAPIFCGLLANYTGICGTSQVNNVYGAATPTKEVDMSMWTNMTPGTGDLTTLLGDGLMTPREMSLRPVSSALDIPDERQRRSSDARDDAGVKGIDELLAAMEDGREEAERGFTTNEGTIQPQPNELHSKASASVSATFHLPTPGTDADSPAMKCLSTCPDTSAAYHFSPPESLSSPNVSASSGAASSVSNVIPSARLARARHPTSLAMPTVPFIPPPPMCMFFNPAFHDLQKGKVGVWKGELEVRGKGGGKFSILIVGEEGSGHLWQSHLWPSQISYPAEHPPESSSCTSTMIPVSHLAREGFTPIAMGMVLSNDADVTGYVNMVQGLHAEGVAFHLPNPARLPIVFLPSKFESSDPLQRLGIAFMSKPGLPVPQRPSGTSVPTGGLDEGSKKKRRRQSAPARPSSSTAGRKRETLISSLGKRGRIEEEAIAEDSG